jgi:hypothetical protein
MSSAIPESVAAKCLRIQEEARLARERFQSYYARSYGPGVTDLALLVRLERASRQAERRLSRVNPARM